MAQTQSVEVKIKAILDAGPSVAGLKELKKLQKEVGAGTSEFKLAQKGINDFSDSVKTAKSQSQDWVDSLGAAPGPIGAIARGYDQLTSSTNKWGLAWKATGIGLLVALVGQLVMAFSQNEKAMKKLEPIMIAFEQILGGIFKALEPVFDIMIDLAVKAMPYVQKAIGGLYTAFFTVGSLIKNFFIGTMKLGQAWAKIFKGIFTFDLDTVKEGLGDIKQAFVDGVNGVVDDTKKSWGRYEDGLDDVTKTQKKNLDEQNKNQKDATAKQKEQIDSLLKAREADLSKQKALAMDAAKTEEERLAIEKKFANDSYLAKKKALEDTQKLYPIGSKEYKDYTSQLTSLEAEYIGKKTEFRNKELELTQKAFDNEVKAAQNANKLKIDDLTNTLNLQKQIYGENSKEARAAQDEIFKTQMEGLEAEKLLYENKKTLTDAEKQRLQEIVQAQENLTVQTQIESDKRIKIDVETGLKKAEEQKKVIDADFAERMKAAQMDLELQQMILDEKKLIDEKYYQDLLLTENLTAEQRKKIEDDFTASKKANADAQIQIEEKKFQAQQALLGATVNAISAVADIIGKNTVAGKALAVAASLINTYSAIAGQLRAFAGVPIPGYAIVQAVATGLVGFKAVADIVKTPVPNGGAVSGGAQGAGGTQVPKPRGLATGGYVSGPGGPKSDLIPAMLSNGESVINAQSTAMFRPLLSTINAIGGGKRFADGGMAIGSFSQDQAMRDLQNTLMTQQMPIKTYVVSSDMTSQQMMDRNIKERSTL